MAPLVATNSVALEAGHVGLVEVATGADDVVDPVDVPLDPLPDVTAPVEDTLDPVEYEVALTEELALEVDDVVDETVAVVVLDDGPNLKRRAPRRFALLTALPTLFFI